MNEAGAVVGWTLGERVEAYVARPGAAYVTLPLPPGYASAWAQGINDAGVVVGSASTGGYPEFGEAIAWYPDEAGGYTPQLLGTLPDHLSSIAYAINNRGEIVGVSLIPGYQSGPTVWFNSPLGLFEISSLGAPGSPKQINDEGVMVGIQGGLFDLDTLEATPLPKLPAGWSGFQGWAINARGELAGTAIQGGIRRSAAIWTHAGGWQSMSPEYSISASVQAFDINVHGLAYAEVPQPLARFDADGQVTLASVLPAAEQAQWSFPTQLGGAVNNAGQIAAIGRNSRTGESGVVILTPVSCASGSPACPSGPETLGRPAPAFVAGLSALPARTAANEVQP